MSAKNFHRVPDGESPEGFIVPGYSAWDCDRCSREVRRYRGMSDVACECGAWYNAGGQRLRDNWRDNPAWRDDSVSDLEGFEIECLRREGGL